MLSQGVCTINLCITNNSLFPELLFQKNQIPPDHAHLIIFAVFVKKYLEIEEIFI